MMGPLLAHTSHAKRLTYMLAVPELLLHVLNEFFVASYGQKSIIHGFHPRST